VLIETPADLTAEWLTDVLGAGPVADFTYQRIGTGQMSECYRVGLTYADGPGGPPSVVLKVAASDPTSRQTGLAMGLYEREVNFYAEIAPRVVGPIAPCHHHAFDPETGAFDLLLDDAAPAAPGDEIRGATIEQAFVAVRELGRVHGGLLGDRDLAGASWLNGTAPVNQDLISALYAGFVGRYGAAMTPEQQQVCERFVGAFDDYLATEGADDRPKGLVHGDFRLDNLLFGLEGAARPLTIVDWQTVTWGPAMTDLAYFLGCALPTEVRRANWDGLVGAYHEALGSGCPLTLADVRNGVRRASFMGITMTIIASMVVERTDRGDQMFLAMHERNCSHVLDTDALAVLA
jgi:Ecdysteroid kinase-like family